MATTVDERLERLERRLNRVEDCLGLDTERRTKVEAPPIANRAPPLPHRPQPVAPTVVAPPLPPAVTAPPVVAGRPMQSVAPCDDPSVDTSFISRPAPAPDAAVIAMPVEARQAIQPRYDDSLPVTQQSVHAVLQERGVRSERANELSYHQPEALPPVRQTNLERTVGLKWAGWAGAVVLVMGAALAVKYAYDQGWLGGLPAVYRLIMMYIGGFSLIGAGEYVYRRVNKLSAVGLFSAGVASLFLVSYAGYAYYELYPAQLAFALMVIATVVGAAVAIRGRLVSIATLSLVGGNLAPFVLGQGETPLLAFLTYLLALQIVALYLAWWGRTPRWWTLRGLTLATTSLWTASLIGAPETSAMPALLAGFMAVCAGLFHFELIVSARRVDAGDVDRISVVNWVALATTVTALLTFGLLAALDLAAPLSRGATVLTLSGITCAVGTWLSRLGTGRTLARLATAYKIHAAGLLVVALPIMFGGVALTFAWAGLAVVFAAVGAMTDSRIARWFGPLNWLLAAVYLLVWHTNHTDHTLTVLGHILPTAGAIAIGLAMVGLAVARLVGTRLTEVTDDGIFAGVARLTGCVATATLLIGSIACFPPLGTTAVFIAYAWAMLGLDRVAKVLGLPVHAAVIFGLAAAKWVVVDTIATRLSDAWATQQYLPVLNPLMGVGVLLAASIALAGWLRRDAIVAALGPSSGIRSGGDLLTWGIRIITALLTLGLTMEVDRVVERAIASGEALASPATQLKLLSWTILWTCALVGSRAMALWAERRHGVDRGDGTLTKVLAACLLAKYIAIDTLGFRLTHGVGSAAVVANLHVLTALVLAAGLLALRWLSSGSIKAVMTSAATIATATIIAWAGTLEVDRFVTYLGSTAWPEWQLRHLFWTMWWTLCAVAAMLGVYRFSRDESGLEKRDFGLKTLSDIVVMLAAKFLVLDTLLFRLTTAAPNVLVGLNLIVATAVVPLFGLGMATYLQHLCGRKLKRGATVAALTGTLLLLWVGTLEVERTFINGLITGLASPARAASVAISIYWAVYAIGTLAVGFRFRTSALRYFGLTLLAIALLKVVFIDLSQVEKGYRILSFMGLGIVLLGTSVLYGKLGPVLLKEEKEVAA